MTIDSDDRVWFCPDTNYFLASVTDADVNFVLPKAPTQQANALSVSGSHFVFFGGYRQSSMVAVVERQSQRLRLIQLRGAGGSPLVPDCVATRGPRAIAVFKNEVFNLDQAALLEVLGPWTDENTSTVASAAQYSAEEDSYSPVTQLYPGPIRQIPGKPRPPGNLSRADDDPAP